METAVVKIGNSKAIILPKIVLKKYNMHNTIELILLKDCIILKSKSTARKGWETAFKKMHKNGDDKLLITDVFIEESFE